MRYRTLIAFLALAVPGAAALAPAAAQDRDGTARDGKAHDGKAHDGKTAGSTAARRHPGNGGNRTAAGSIEMLTALRKAQKEKSNK